MSYESLTAFFDKARMLETGYAMPHDISVHGWRIDQLINTTIVFVSILFLIMVVWLLWACLRHGEHHEARYGHGDSRPAMRKKLAVAAVIFLGVDGNLFVNSTIDLHDVFWNFAAVEARPETLRLEINARQWAWEARYAGPDGRFGTRDDVLTTNDIYVPVGVPVLLQLAASDVLHSLYIPNLRIKQDVIPGTLTRAWFEAKETGELEVGCSQHCGVAHYKMRGRLHVMPADAFASWQRDAGAMALAGFDERDTGAQWGWEWRKP